MNEITFQKSVKKKRLLLSFFVLFSLVISVKGSAQNFSIKDHIKIFRKIGYYFKEGIDIHALVYDYSSGANKHQFLQHCTFEASVNDAKYFKLMEINTPQQNWSELTSVYFKDKLAYAIIQFDENVILQSGKVLWPEELSKKMKATSFNVGTVALFHISWRFRQGYRDVRYIRISGQWKDEEKKHVESFRHIVYDLDNPSK